ncbi:DUF4385 domain-containing protein [Flavobacterium sp.]|uniref:DUF4385 domain-containing protein n=1 Tax=Flavobacterium sp. TaxID=239 RepID=UPI001215B45D|nr:DUF4385 domain-containing protein [Flavobacterium sp.]RZJ73050.1 MAG: DUF4385 domain-containing protein [Flavobacterium sp.]
METPSYLDFDNKNYDWKPTVDYRENPERYKVGKGEQGVLICEPYKGEIGKFWRFKTREIATESSEKILELFLDYLKKDDFVGADMARKYLQMGFTRARRYANYKGGKKFDKDDGYRQLVKGTGESEKAEAAKVFYDAWKKAESNPDYAKRKLQWKKTIG